MSDPFLDLILFLMGLIGATTILMIIGVLIQRGLKSLLENLKSRGWGNNG